MIWQWMDGNAFVERTADGGVLVWDGGARARAARVIAEAGGASGTYDHISIVYKGLDALPWLR